ncbi:hypothetical protein C4D60_Mb10t11310 [Musa balbisiana]|uniref:Large ribosomal subunit protein bL12 C-terminal domain-containing protein n=1 Tax=Musa balbisiana TaxID=52838 RepID=A0A4S8IXP0_MUSBA|nr:hypothetical protein C4D60_Mb10t11310 [Musa balbisiana]
MAPQMLLRRLLFSAARHFSSSTPSGGVATESRTQKLERIADELLSLTKEERNDYSILFRLKLGLNQLVQAGGGLPSAGTGPGVEAATEEKEKTAFDIKLEKFDAAAKIKIIKEVRTFTDLGLKEAKELVEKAPVVLKKGVTKEEAEAIAAKLKEIYHQTYIHHIYTYSGKKNTLIVGKKPAVALSMPRSRRILILEIFNIVVLSVGVGAVGINCYLLQQEH